MGLDKHRALWYGLVMSMYTHGLTGAQQGAGTGQNIPDSHTPQLIGGVAGGGLMLLVVVITMCVLLRYRRTGDSAGGMLGGRTQTQIEKDQGSDEPLGQECGVYSEIQKQPKTVPEFCGQDGVDGGSIYAKPDKRRESACDDQS